ncbi:MAG TPA: SulP family inorganic anion transporter [Gemmatimonadota bacterium]|nr:SulP family inorganic anion transporter [Gemmatimonadota bacterium]
MKPGPPKSLAHREFEPKLVSILRAGYSRRQFAHDLAAGVQVGIVALPLSLALAIASGVRPEQGLFTAIVAGFLISALGGSRVQIGGPTGAFIVLVYGIVQTYGYEGLAVATMMAGGLMVLMGVARLGNVIKFVPYPVTVGFTSGIAIIIAVSQIRDLFGLDMASVPADFLEKILAYSDRAGAVNFWALGVGLSTVIFLVLWPRVNPRIPGPLLVLVLATLIVIALDLPVETIGDRFGAVPQMLPAPSLPSIGHTEVRALFPSAIAIALLASIESLLSAVVADGMMGGRHRSNMELVAQGVANVASPIFGGIPATGAIARTALNVRSGGRTPVAGIVHAFTVLLILFALAPLAGLVPMAALAGVLLLVAYHMSEWRLFVKLFRSPKSDVLVLLTTFLLTVLVDLVVALQAGIVLASFLFMRRMADLSEASYVQEMLAEDADEAVDPAITEPLPHGVEMFKVHGTLFFGAASKFKDAIRRVEKPPRVLILRIREVLAIDATGLRALEDLLDKAESDGTKIVMTAVQAQPRAVLERAGILARVGPENVVPDFARAVERSKEILSSSP